MGIDEVSQTLGRLQVGVESLAKQVEASSALSRDDRRDLYHRLELSGQQQTELAAQFSSLRESVEGLAVTVKQIGEVVGDLEALRNRGVGAVWVGRLFLLGGGVSGFASLIAWISQSINHPQ